MGKRIRLGLIFSVDVNWIGGTYYILNLISALGTLPKERQPYITILSKNPSDFSLAKETGYQFLNYQNPFDYKRNLAEASLNKFLKIFTKTDTIDKRISKNTIDVLFPASNDACFERIKRKIYWFPDFQHIFYPEFFKATELDFRNKVINQIANQSNPLVLSSQAAKRDWESLGLTPQCPVHVIPFAVTHSEISDINITGLMEEFNIVSDYFIVSNQFWKHKNHFIVLKAIMQLKQKGIQTQFVFTGKEDDYRNPGYYQSIVDFVKLNNLDSNIKMLGLIDRRKQLRLMQHALAVVQPSLFEGWSTVIEDAKSLGTTVIASDIPVHKEQLKLSSLFFNPRSEDELVDKILEVVQAKGQQLSVNYTDSVFEFGQSFHNILNKSFN